MKKVLFLLLASFLVLGACSQKEESKSEDKKSETVKKADKKDNKKKEKKETDKKNVSNKEVANNNTANQQVDNSEQPTVQQDNSQQNTAQQTTEQTQTNNVQHAPQKQDDTQQPLTQEQMEANAKVAKQHGYTGIPNGDAGMMVPQGPASSSKDTQQSGMGGHPSMADSSIPAPSYDAPQKMDSDGIPYYDNTENPY